MMGKSHMITGSTGWLVAGVPALEAAGQSLSGPEIVAGTVVAAGASMLPDLDHPQATASQSLGPFTQTLSKFLAFISGGHRNGTHSILFALIVGTGLALMLRSTEAAWVALLTCFFFTSLVVRTMAEVSSVMCAAISLVAGAAMAGVSPSMDWLFLSVAIGCLLHDVGDILTPQGVPPMWPISKKRVSLPLIGHTGDWREKLISAGCGTLTCYLIAVNVYLPLTA